MKNILMISAFAFGVALANTGHEGHDMSNITFKENNMREKSSAEDKASIGLVKIEHGKMFVKLTDGKGFAIKNSDLKTAHTKKVHIFIISENLEFYKHMHPRAEKEQGIYSFEWKDFNASRNYKVWADITPIKTGKQEYIYFDIKGDSSEPVKASKNMDFTSADGMKFQISFDKPLKANADLTMKFTVLDKSGKLFKGLEPIMGAFAHAVGFSVSNKNIIHTHPLGQEVHAGKGGPDLFFHINFKQAGYTKMWLQVQIDRKGYFIPFGFDVK